PGCLRLRRRPAREPRQGSDRSATDHRRGSRLGRPGRGRDARRRSHRRHRDAAGQPRRMTRRWLARVRGLLTHEWTLAVLAAVALALVVNRGALADPAHTLPRDIWDPSYHAYLLAWGGHALRHDPLGIWHFNAFYPAPYGLAFSDSLLGYAPFGLVGTGQEAAVLRYNAVYIGAYAMVLLGGYALARQLGLRPGPAALVGVALAMAPWRLSHTGHLNVLSTGGVF